MDNHNARHSAAQVNLIAAYAVIVKTLAALPLPIAIPSVIGSMYVGEVHEDLLHAYHVLTDLPMDQGVRHWVREMILDWIIAADVMFEDAQDPESWKIDFVEVQIARILANGKYLRDELS